MTQEQRTQTEPTSQEKLQQSFLRAESIVNGERNDLKDDLDRVVANSQIDLAFKVGDNTRKVKDFKKHLGGYGEMGTVSVEGLRAASLKEFDFRWLPKEDAFSGLADEEELGVSLGSSYITVRNKKKEVIIDILYDSAYIRIHSNVHKGQDPFVRFPDSERTRRFLVAAELLMWLNGEVDKKLQEAIQATP